MASADAAPLRHAGSLADGRRPSGYVQRQEFRFPGSAPEADDVGPAIVRPFHAEDLPGLTDVDAVDVMSCNHRRPDFISQIRPTFDETVEGHKPEISETQTGLFETDLQSSPLAHIP
jgi:hypothetical protein